MGYVYGVIGFLIFSVGLLILFLDIYVVYCILTRPGDPTKKLLWLIVVLLLPIIGPILYLMLGRGAGTM